MTCAHDLCRSQHCAHCLLVLLLCLRVQAELQCLELQQGAIAGDGGLLRVLGFKGSVLLEALQA